MVALERYGATMTPEHHKLVAFCDKCQEWYKFVKPEPSICPACVGKPSVKVGFQVTTQRTFNASARKLSKAQLKRLGGV